MQLMQEKTIPAQINQLETLIDFINECMDKAGVDDMFRVKPVIALEEIFVNIANYAYPDNNGEVTINFKAQPDKLIFEFTDSGIPYDPLDKPDPDITLSASERAIGGLGIFMVKKIMDEVIYKHQNGQNILTLIKNR